MQIGSGGEAAVFGRCSPSSARCRKRRAQQRDMEVAREGVGARRRSGPEDLRPESFVYSDHTCRIRVGMPRQVPA